MICICLFAFRCKGVTFFVHNSKFGRTGNKIKTKISKRIKHYLNTYLTSYTDHRRIDMPPKTVGSHVASRMPINRNTFARGTASP